MQRLKDKAIIITGAATGIGPAIASACVADADGLLLVDHNPAVMDVVGASGGVGLQLDVTAPSAAQTAIAPAVSRSGGWTASSTTQLASTKPT